MKETNPIKIVLESNEVDKGDNNNITTETIKN